MSEDVFQGVCQNGGSKTTDYLLTTYLLWCNSSTFQLGVKKPAGFLLQHSSLNHCRQVMLGAKHLTSIGQLKGVSVYKYMAIKQLLAGQKKYAASAKPLCGLIYAIGKLPK